ncbi:hypothetical protein JHN55_28230 [Streptomyces sp. MBT56]|uniref:hypothetical protein n=1 Tax=unclassified Streptomyces TaxID=2593676 RepID=UPI00190B0E5F|nr:MULTISPECIES: hypothetical protein [unclassified Streptomyces]MBK3534752.1 hypothetical protein [Streptomyces sp. MBT67]MBK3560348.1 hypothetical protein [Streptomyces sp. MBT56]MBK3600013.1 hypothetical protein [Streptomyces sp. MBT54]MBK3613268.1 hypothetical protein [Streptomyces sp. MBT98]
MDGAVVGLIGTVVGAVSGVLGTLATTRLGGAEQRRTQRGQSEREGRAVAYSNLVTECSRTYRVGYTAHVALQAARGVQRSPNVGDSLVGFRPAVEATLEAVSLVRLHGPDRVARAANNLASAMKGWCHEVELLYDGEGDEQRASEAIELYEEMEERFLALGRETLSGVLAR